MAYNVYLQFQINLTDRALVDTLQGTQFGGGDVVGAVIMAPDTAATTYAAPKVASRVSPVAAPSITSEYFDTAKHFPTDVRTFDRKEGGWFGIGWLFGTTVHYYWRGLFVYQPSLTPTNPDGSVVPVPPPISTRRFIDGFEIPLTGDGGTGSATAEMTRDASRRVDGFGLALRSSTSQRTHTVTENISPAYTPKNTWERFYYRRRNAPAAQTVIWSQKGGIEGTAGVGLAILPSGQLSAIKIDNAGVITALATSAAPLTVDQWYRFDLVIKYDSTGAALDSLYAVYVNGTLMSTVAAFPGGTGLGLNTTHVSSTIGQASANTLNSDFDDWISADLPATLNGLDWLNGSAVVPIVARGDGASRASWTGDWRIALQLPILTTPGTNITSAVAAARLALTTDVAESVLAREGVIGSGVVALLVAKNGLRNAASGNGTLGWTIAGVDTLATITEPTAAGWNRVLYRPAGLAAPAPVTGLELVHVHGTGAFSNSVASLMASAEVLGVFGPEDVVAGATILDAQPASLGPHNAPYPHSPWARRGVPPPAPVSIKTGTYVGNGTNQDLAFRNPVHWLRIRPLTGDAGGVRWFPSMIAAHKSFNEGFGAPLMPQVLIDPAYVPPGGVTGTDVPATPATLALAIQTANDYAYDNTHWVSTPALVAAWAGDATATWRLLLGEGAAPADVPLYGAFAVPPSPWGNVQGEQTIVRITGADTQINAAGVTYAYTAFSDPGMRFCVAGVAVDHRMIPAADMASLLKHPTFLPVGGFLLKEAASTSATASHFYKGPGHAANAASPLDAGETASAMAFAAGLLTIKSAFGSIAYTQFPYALFRTNDGSGNVGVPRVVCIMSYVGDGNASRSVALLPASGRRPMFAIVVPHNGPAYERDPSHTGTTSTQLPSTANAATGIIGGGIDTISVGINLNANGITYDLFVFPGDSTPGNGGWSPPGDFDPVPPVPPPDGPWDPVPTDPDAPVPVPPSDPDTPTPPAAPPDDFGTSCRAASEVLINLALARIGQNEQIVNVNTDATAAAAAGRLHYSEAVQTTLRDFPWPFATKYSVLTLVAGSAALPVNRDWMYSYRRPSDCVFERRIVVARAGALDPTPPAFQLSSDATGGLILTNEPLARLEYTARPVCIASVGDPLFREALVCRLAANMAPALSRIEGGPAAMLEQYVQAIVKAEQVLRPGNPGTRGADFVGDTGAGCMTANVALANRALVRIGAKTIASLTTDQSQSATAARMIFEDELLSVLRDFPWPFATVYNAALVLVGGTSAVPVNADWQYSYRLPAEAVFVRRLVREGTGRAYDPDPPTFKLGRDATGALLFTDEDAPIAEYTIRPSCCVASADPLFRDALAWRLAASLAPSLAQPDPETPEQVGRGPEPMTKPKVHPANKAQMRLQVQRFAWAMYEAALARARVAAANESEREPPGDASWISERN